MLNLIMLDLNKEDVISTRQFRLSIFNTSKADVNCYYKCVYGFKFDYVRFNLIMLDLIMLDLIMLNLNTTKYQCKYKLNSFI